LVRPGRAYATPIEPWRRLLTGVSRRRLALAQHRTTWEPPQIRAVRAAWTLGGGRCYSLASASVDPLLAHPLSSGRNVFRLEAEHVCLLGGVSRRLGCGPYARPLFMSALAKPSREPSQPLAPHVTTRHRRVVPNSDRQLEPRALLSNARGLFHREARIVPPSPRLEEPSPLSREDGGTTRGAFRRAESSACFRRSTRPFSHTHPTPRGAGQSHSSCRPCYVLA
jgi:hypothetical protein